MTISHFVAADDIRERFSRAMSTMYQKEVPQYAALLSLVASVNHDELARDSALRQRLKAQGELTRLHDERHGAIRVGTAEEFGMLRRLFAVMGMFPVGYYDLAEAGVPVHSTAFRPVDEQALRRNPFRIFTSLLRLELIDDTGLRERAAALLARRDIFTAGTRELIDRYEAQGGLTDEQAERFVNEALKTFRWHHEATVDLETYRALHAQHRLIADVVCFRGPHINHLTPRTLNIDEVQRRMPEAGMTPKAVIEGPPRRCCPILLRQTSFKALEEPVRFADERTGMHTARFGEIEQRGVALTREGRRLYDQLLSRAREQAADGNSATYQEQLASAFAEFPDDQLVLRQRGLAYFRYELTEAGRVRAAQSVHNENLERLIEQGLVQASPITYEDFLPVSAAGIFQSNLGDGVGTIPAGSASKGALELALGTRIIDEFDGYARREQASRDAVMKAFAG